jgi:hypothetical protein
MPRENRRPRLLCRPCALGAAERRLGRHRADVASRPAMPDDNQRDREDQGSMRYENPVFVSRATSERVLRDGPPCAVATAIIAAALYAPDPGWVEAASLDLAESGDRNVRSAAAIAFAHLARRFRRLDDIVRITAVLDRLEKDPDLAGRVSDVRDDFKTFLGSRRPEPGHP